MYLIHLQKVSVVISPIFHVLSNIQNHSLTDLPTLNSACTSLGCSCLFQDGVEGKVAWRSGTHCTFPCLQRALACIPHSVGWFISEGAAVIVFLISYISHDLSSEMCRLGQAYVIYTRNTFLKVPFCYQVPLWYIIWEVDLTRMAGLGWQMYSFLVSTCRGYFSWYLASFDCSFFKWLIFFSY